MALTAAEVLRDYETDGVPSSGPHEVKKSDFRTLLGQYEQIINAFTSNGGVIYSSLAALNADLAKAADTMAWVIEDATAANNGVYRKVGASGTGSWVRAADLPYSFIVASDVGDGTPDAIVATSSLPVSGSALVLLNIFEANTGSPVTVSFNGGTPLTVKSNSGNDIAPSGLQAGMLVMGRISGSTFRIVTDQVSAAIVAQAEAAAQVATDKAAEAVAAAAGVDLPPVTANTMLVDNAAGTARESKTFEQVKALLNIGSGTLLNVKTEFGAVGDGVVDDSTALQDALDAARDDGVGLFLPAGRYKITVPLTYHTTILTGNFGKGLTLVGEGHRNSVLVNSIAAGGTTLDLYSTEVGTFMQGGRIADIGFEQSGSGANSHGIEYEGVWNAVFERVRMEGLNGNGFQVNNPGDGDGKSSAHVRIVDCYLRDNVGSAWTSNGGNGGVTLHTLESCYIVGNGGVGGGGGQVVIDGCIHFVMRMCSVAAFGENVPLVWIKKTNLHSQTLKFEQGEYGNDSGIHFVVDGVVNMQVDGIRHVRRLGENNSTFGYYFGTGPGRSVVNVVIKNVEVAIDNGPSSDPVGPAWTFLYCDVAGARIKTEDISGSIGTGNTLYTIAGSGVGGNYKFEDFSGAAVTP